MLGMRPAVHPGHPGGSDQPPWSFLQASGLHVLSSWAAAHGGSVSPEWGACAGVTVSVQPVCARAHSRRADAAGRGRGVPGHCAGMCPSSPIRPGPVSQHHPPAPPQPGRDTRSHMAAQLLQDGLAAAWSRGCLATSSGRQSAWISLGGAWPPHPPCMCSIWLAHPHMAQVRPAWKCRSETQGHPHTHAVLVSRTNLTVPSAAEAVTFVKICAQGLRLCQPTRPSAALYPLISSVWFAE